MSSYHIKDIHLNLRSQVTRLSKLVGGGKDSFDELLATIEAQKNSSTNNNSKMNTLIHRLRLIATRKVESINGGDWLKRLKGTDLYQLRVDQYRAYFFRYDKKERRVIFLNWCKKKSEKTKPGVLARAESLKRIAESILDQE